MGTYTLQGYRKELSNKIKRLRKSGDKSSFTASKYMVAQAKRLAPRKTGQTISGIRKRKRKSGQWTVESWVPGTFKQNMFANQTAPYRTLNYSEQSIQPFYAIPQKVVYGKGAISPSGNQIRWTGTPRFFHFAWLRTRDYFRKVTNVNTKKALRGAL